jgi:hypothetical protein
LSAPREAVRPEETGVAAGMNTVMRSIGLAIGGQVGASVLTANVSHGLPTEHGFTLAFALGGAAAVGSFFTALAVPARRRSTAGIPRAECAAIEVSAPEPATA